MLGRHLARRTSLFEEPCFVHIKTTNKKVNNVHSGNASFQAAERLVPFRFLNIPFYKKHPLLRKSRGGNGCFSFPVALNQGANRKMQR